ncbi:hypothetical protein [Leptothermofonsia sp. ETS-13]|uniref:hypothetical protein n=1 Tax=Leptothermofonsia sp. ETS-13 TaxID=3035696 RepID=UPI003B9DD12A
MKYSRYYKSLVGGFLTSCLAFLLLTAWQTGAPTRQSRWIYESYQFKSNLVNSVKSPKLLVISGSNSLLGISCEMIQEKTKLSCVNAAINAGLGVNYILHYARSFARPGDIILLPLEYEFYQSDGALDSVLIDYVFARDPQYLQSIDFQTQLRFIEGLSFKRLMTGISSRLASSKALASSNPPGIQPDNARSSVMNSYGDRIDNLEARITPELRRKIDATQPMKVNSDMSTNMSGFQAIAKFADWCKKNNVRLLATWPNTIWFKDYEGAIYQVFFQKIENFYRSINVPVIGKYRDSMYEKSLFYDTNYHLNDRGVRHRTQQLIEVLQPYLANPSQRRNFKINS